MTHGRIEDVEQVFRMVRVLAEVGYRDLSKSANQIRYALCRRLWREGVDEPVLRLLWAYANECGSHPEGLFAHWLASPRATLAKIDEMRTKNAWLRRAIDNIKDEAPPQQEPAPIIDIEKHRRKA